MPRYNVVADAPNRRRAIRRQPKDTIRVYCIAGKAGVGANLALQLFDVSETGAQFRMQTPLPVGSAVEIGLEAIGDLNSFHTAARVVWCVTFPDGRNCVGVWFDKPLDYALFQHLANF